MLNLVRLLMDAAVAKSSTTCAPCLESDSEIVDCSRSLAKRGCTAYVCSGKPEEALLAVDCPEVDRCGTLADIPLECANSAFCIEWLEYVHRMISCSVAEASKQSRMSCARAEPIVNVCLWLRLTRASLGRWKASRQGGEPSDIAVQLT